MEKLNVSRVWAVAAVILVLILVAAVFLLWTLSPAKAQTVASVSVQWRPGSVLEAMFAARIAADNRSIQNGLQAFAKNRDMTPDEMRKYVGGTYLSVPRLWTKTGWVDGWDKVLPLLKEIILPGSQPIIHTVLAAIEYRPPLGKEPGSDIDAVATVQMTLSASPGDTVMGGQLCHSRICEILTSCEQY